jgi:hypothetical protein
MTPMVLVKAGLYAAVALLTPVAAIMSEFAQRDQWPSGVILTAALLTGLVQALIAVRAYFDGSAERAKP